MEEIRGEICPLIPNTLLVEQCLQHSTRECIQRLAVGLVNLLPTLVAIAVATVHQNTLHLVSIVYALPTT
ncbi:MAG: hypothetical protein ACTHWH_15145 [Marinobacter sp.]